MTNVLIDLENNRNKKNSLESRINILKALNINLSSKLIHVAGTNGKGSTVSFLKHALISQGYSVGTFISPYVTTFYERITYNNNNISKFDFSQYYNKFMSYGFSTSYFETIFFISLLYFCDKQPDYIIFEVGIGGRDDVTNILDYKLNILTNVTYDHMDILGHTLEEICNNKLGIVKKDNILISSISEDLRPLVEKRCSDTNSKVYYVKPKDIFIDEYTHFSFEEEKFSLSLLGEFQAYNCSCAIKALKILNVYDYNVVYTALKDTFWPGRFEKLSDKPLLYIDGAHNIDAIIKLKDNIKKVLNNEKIIIFFAALKTKEVEHMLLELIEYKVILVKFEDLKAEDLEKYKSKYEILSNIEKAIKYTHLASFDTKFVVCGSLHFISQFREKYLNNFK